MVKFIKSNADSVEITVNKKIKFIKLNKEKLNSAKLEDNSGVQICGGGVYVFVVKQEVKDFDVDKFNADVTGSFIDENIIYYKVISVPTFNMTQQKRLKEGFVFYVGKSGNLKSRLHEHWTNNLINNCVSLKLGFKNRGSMIKDKLEIYVTSESNEKNRKSLELAIRKEYGAYFGK